MRKIQSVSLTMEMSFCSKNNVDGKHVITYINHLKDIDIRKDITTIEAEKRKRQEAEPTYKDFKWDTSPLSRVARSKS